MYPSMPSPPVQSMQGDNPAQQFGYMPTPMRTPMQQGIGSLQGQMPMYGAYPTYMAQGGPVSAKGQGMPPMQGLSQQAPTSGKGQQTPMDQQAPMQMPGTSMNSAMEDFSRQQAMQQGGGGKGQGMGPMQGGGGFPAIPRNEAEARMMEQQPMGQMPVPFQMPQQGPQDVRADYERFRQGRGDRRADFRQRMQNPDIPPVEKQRMIEEFRRGTEQAKQISQDFRQKLYPGRQVGQQQMPQQQLDQLRMAEQMSKMRGMPGPTQTDRMNATQAQQALPAGIQALANFRPQY